MSPLGARISPAERQAFAPRYATLVWVVIIPLRLLVARLTKWPSWRPTGT